MTPVGGRTPGIHHVTAIAGDPQRNLDFYTRVLGLRLVKRTVNFDDPGSYHFYFGDESGLPGTLLTFFPWPDAPRGRPGVGQATAICFAVPEASLGFWSQRLRRQGVEPAEVTRRFAEDHIGLRDPDGLRLELVGSAGADRRPAWDAGPVPGEHAVRGLFGVTLCERGAEATEPVLTRGLGLRRTAETGQRLRFQAEAGQLANVVDVLLQPDGGPGQLAAGTVHHVAFRARTAEEQQSWQTDLAGLGLHVTPILERCYFRSVYFREPGGVLFEIATDGPGFATDEPVAELGQALKLPPWLEGRRAALVARLPAIELRYR